MASEPPPQALDPATSPGLPAASPDQPAPEVPPAPEVSAAPALPPPVPEPRSWAAPRPWGPLLSVVLTAVVLLAYSVAQSIPAMIVLLEVMRTASPAAPLPVSPAGLPDIPNAGLHFAVGTLVAAPLGIAFVLLLAGARRGLPIRRYLALRRPGWRSVALGVGLLAVFNVAYDLTSSRLGRPEVPGFMVDAVRTAVFAPALWVAIALAAPAFEELLFRGFLLEGLRCSRVGSVGAALLSSAMFAAIHLQYDLFDMTAVFALGLLFAVMRLQSGSTWLTLGLHALSNLVAIAQVTWYLRGR